MASEVLRPTSAVAATWNVSTVTNIDDDILHGEAGDTLTIMADKDDDNETQAYQITDITGLTVIRTLVLHVLTEDLALNGNTFNVDIDHVGAALASITFNANDSGIWKSRSEVGTWTPAQVNAMQIHFNTGLMGNDDEIDVDAAYVEAFDVIVGRNKRTRLIPVMA